MEKGGFFFFFCFVLFCGLNTFSSSFQQSVQPLVELREFLHFMSQDSHFGVSIDPFCALLATWSGRSPNATIKDWDDIVTGRRLFTRVIADVSGIPDFQREGNEGG